ncbi:MAG TPA: alpha/beta hydrolase [Capillimicrobium sp.]|jgi:pimeloyl-ACP methyl ester carboxylesterase
MARRLALAVAAAAALLAAPAPALADLRFSRACEGSNFECARLVVPLDRSGRVPGEVELYVERARGARRARGAVFALAGGPGQGATTLTEAFNRDLFGAIGPRDLIVVDQRGTGRSGALRCRALDVPDDRPIDVRTAACARRLGARRSLYTTRDSVADLEAVRAALGIDRITLLGVSYGTKVALAYAATHPDHVERLVLDSVVDVPGQDPFDADGLAALPRVLDEICRGECAAVTRDLAADVAALAGRLQDAPLRGPVVSARGRARTRELTGRALYSLIRAGDGLPDTRAALPSAVRAALDGDPAPLLRLEHRFDDLDPGPPTPEQVRDGARSLSFTLQAATLCEEAPLPWERAAPPAQRAAQAEAAALARPDAAFAPFGRAALLAEDANSLLLQCRRWPAAPAAPSLPPAVPDVPALLLAGREDTRTPLEVAQRVAARLPRGALVEVPKTGHAVLGQQPCARRAVARFFAGRPVGEPCRAAQRAVAVSPAAPRALTALAPGEAGLRRATALTLADLAQLRASGFGLEREGGLRAGWYAAGAEHVRLRGFSFVEGVALSGRLRLDRAGAARGQVQVRAGRARALAVVAGDELRRFVPLRR